MTYGVLEGSRDSGAPIECYRFAAGTFGTFLYTSHDNPVTLNGDVYIPEPIRASAPDFSQEDHAGTISVFVSRFNPVAQMYIPFTSATPVALSIYRLHEGDGDSILVFVGKVVGANFGGSDAELICSPMISAVRRNIPRASAQNECPWVTYGIGCGLDKEDFKDEGVLLGADGYTLTADVFATRADGWFTWGWIELLGARRFIVGHVGNTVTLQAPFIPVPPPGTGFYAFAGDDHLESTCRTKFNNIANFNGQPRIPLKNPHEVGLG